MWVAALVPVIDLLRSWDGQRLHASSARLGTEQGCISNFQFTKTWGDVR